MDKITKSTTWLPLGLVITLALGVMGLATQAANIKSDIRMERYINRSQSELLLELTQEIRKLNINLVRQETVLKALEKKIN